MTHRGRRLAALAILLVVLGLVLNNINARTRATQQAAAEEAKPATPAARPLSPLYVPRPASLISGGYGGSLSSESSPQEVAKAFAGAYVKYDPDSGTAEDFLAGLPRLAPDARDKVRPQLAEDWDRYLSQIGGGATVASVSDPDPTAQQNGEAELTVIMDTQNADQGTLKMSLVMTKGDIGWEVTTVTLAGE
ncbi:hypothetical protein OG562_23145 [Streptomyces sp. NBC_01275]|uniref:hypothetical protein n=1 Tax=Streptomyces sp. NBC_01275 TaxID=2903807 RepID=UPI00224CDFA2|nr:hypothetical protein [Streptomyces sp. NBC_01275]MCX4763810.1 hypothetical protein [Streptomyces sp. NBC_01275]